ncbi:MAG: TonB-dependent receptor [Candidatus Krumholzibacteriota bacterium]|nr:TonB-dependent receptor [Candidatus Krumholzibacteriota bacterium]
MRSRPHRLSFLPIALALCLTVLRPVGASAEKGAESRNKPEKSQETLLDTLFWAPEIVVEGFHSTPGKEIFNRSGFVGLIELEKGKSAFEDAAGILSNTVGVRIKQYGGLGSFATMSIRGSSSTQVQVYIDGVPLNDAWSGMTDLADLSLEDIGRIEVYRGFSPTGFGASSVGGTVNLVPGTGRVGRDGEGANSMSASVAAGSFGARKYSAGADRQLSLLTLHLRAGYTESRGDFSFLDDNATPENPLDDANAIRENNDFTKLSLTGRMECKPAGFTSLSLNHSSVHREGGVPGIGANQSSRARLERQRRITWLRLKPLPVFSGSLHNDATIFYSSTRESFNDPAGEIDLTAAKTDNTIVSYGSNMKLKYFPPVLPLSIETFFEGRKERFHPVEHLPLYEEGPDRKRETLSCAASGDLSLLGDRIIFTYGHRWEWYANEFYDQPFFPWLPPTPQGRITGRNDSPGAGLRLMPFSFLTIKGNAGRYYRVPTFFEMFGNLGSVTGDASLTPETGFNRDIGIILSSERFAWIRDLFIEAIYLHNEIDDLILFFPNSQSTVKPENIGSATVRGVELSAAGSLPWPVRISGNYCWLESVDTGPIPYYNGNSLPGRPEHAASISLQYDAKWWGARWETNYTSPNFLDRANMKEAGARTIHNLNLVIRPPLGGVTFTIEGLNIGDEKTSDVAGFPLPGRSFYASVRYQL